MTTSTAVEIFIGAARRPGRQAMIRLILYRRRHPGGWSRIARGPAGTDGARVAGLRIETWCSRRRHFRVRDRSRSVRVVAAAPALDEPAAVSRLMNRRRRARPRGAVERHDRNRRRRPFAGDAPRHARTQALPMTVDASAARPGGTALRRPLDGVASSGHAAHTKPSSSACAAPRAQRENEHRLRASSRARLRTNRSSAGRSTRCSSCNARRRTGRARWRRSPRENATVISRRRSPTGAAP